MSNSNKDIIWFILTKHHIFISPFFYFRTKLVDGTEVVQEVQAKPKTSYSSPGQGPGLFGNFDEVNGNKPGLEGKLNRFLENFPKE